MISHVPAIAILVVFAIPLFENGNGQENEFAISDAENVIAVYTEDHGWASAGEKELVLAVWPNGDCIFSADSIAGGAPFHQTRVSRQTVERLFQQIQESGFLESPNLNAPRVPPDSKFTSILVRIGGKQLKMQSTHEIVLRRSLEPAEKIDDTTFPATPVAPAAEVQNQKGVQAESDKDPERKAPSLISTRLEQISSLSKDDLVHRAVWNELRMKMECIHLTPSKIASGNLRQEHGNLSWQPAK